MADDPGTDVAVVASDVVLQRGDRMALGRSDFVVPAGAYTVVCGPNGSGKSTLLHAICGLIEPSEGTLRVLGRSPRRVRRRVAYVLQVTRANERLPITVREVVAMGRYASRGPFRGLRARDRDRVDEAMGRLGLEDLATRHVRELSAGQRQRVFIAQGLVQDAELLLMDEPTTGLDEPSRRVIDQVLTEERDSGHTVVVTTHDLSDAAAADQVLLLAGRVVSSGAPDEVLTREHLDSAYGERVVHLPEASVLVDEDVHHPH